MRDTLNAEMQVGLERVKAAQFQRQRQQGLGREIVSMQIQGQRLVAVKNRILQSSTWRTFPDFLGDYIKMKVGPEWGTSELSKPQAERHPLLVWYENLCHLQMEHASSPGEIFSMPQTGAAAAYLHLAYDLYALDHNAELQEKLVGRLRDRDNFDGARYEVHVAAIMIRAGFSLEFEDEDDRRSSHCEFTATHVVTGRKFSVEAKHMAGTRFRVKRQLIRALQKAADHERIVFIDINMPDPYKGVTQVDHVQVALRAIRAFENSKNSAQYPAAYVCITNMPWPHHLQETDIRCEVAFEGFKIPDFKGGVAVPSLRHAIEARERHREMHDLMASVTLHSNIPTTFDGENPEFALNATEPRLLIGNRYLVKDAAGSERPGLLTSATVLEAEEKAVCALLFEDGKSEIYSWPLSAVEMNAWRAHPETFFGRVDTSGKSISDPLELYDFFLSAYSNTPRERLLELLSGAPDIDALQKLDQPALASVFAERGALHALAQSQRT